MITTPSGDSYKVTPIPTPEGDQKVSPIPPGDQSAFEVQEALSLGSFGDFFGGSWKKFKSFGSCMKSLGSCMQATTNNVIEFGGLILQRLVLKQITGEKGVKVVDCQTMSTAEKLNDPDCQQLETASGLREYVANASPGEFGLLGVADYTTSVALNMPLPIDSSQYFASINPFATVRAESGFEDLKKNSIILEVWERVRNATYALSVVVLVIIGFMIMLRLPIDPRTVVGAQNTLPRIVIALILITFSFAIAGLMIDFTRLASSFLHSFLPSFSFFEGVSGIIPLLVSFLALMGSVVGAGALIGGGAPGAFIAGVIFMLLALIVAIGLMVVTFVILYKLLYRLIIFLLLTMFAPLFFLAGALPGGEKFIIGWFKRGAASLLSIVAISFIINLSLAIGWSGLGRFDLTLASGEVPLIGTGVFMQFFSWGFAAPVIGLVLYTTATKVPDIIDELFDIREMGKGKGFGIGSIVMAPLAAAGALGQAGRTGGGLQTLYGGYTQAKLPGTPQLRRIFGDTKKKEPE